MAKPNKIGIVVEDFSDFETISKLMRRISSRDNLSFERFVTEGCGRLINKLDSYAKILYEKKCTALVVVHDKDKRDYDELYQKINSKLKGCAFGKQLICIPIEELEAWFLSDMVAVKEVFGLKVEPKNIPNPEGVVDAKEELQRIVRKHSNKHKISLSTTSNLRLACHLEISKAVKKCPSFKNLFDFTIGLKL